MPLVKKQPTEPFLFWRSPRGHASLFLGDVLEVLRSFGTGSVQMVVTSPPYWGLRSYATGDAKHLEIGSEARPDCLGWARGQNCAEQDWANGCHVCRIVLVFREVRRVLRDDGTLWLNYGDTYASSSSSGRNDVSRMYGPESQNRGLESQNRGLKSQTNLPVGNLIGVPWRVALALQQDGWTLRQDIIWHKPSQMPESVRNRCTKAHEYVFLFSKRRDYFYDAEAIKENTDRLSVRNRQAADAKTSAKEDMVSCTKLNVRDVAVWGANKRSVWTVSSQGYAGAHYAVFPSKLIEPMILAGTSERGACAACGAPWRRVVEQQKLTRERPNDCVKRAPTKDHITESEDQGYDGHRTRVGLLAYHDKMNTCANSVAGVESRTVGWEPGCTCCQLCGRKHATQRPGKSKRMKAAMGEESETESEAGSRPEPTSSNLPEMQESIQGKKNVGVLLKEMRGQMDVGKRIGEQISGGDSGQENQVRVKAAQRQDGEGSSHRDGEEVGTLTADRRGSASSQRGQVGQPPEQPEADEQSSSRQDAYEEAEGHAVVPFPGVPCIVLDPFVGSGTTCDVSVRLGQRSVGIDLSREYLERHAIRRIEEAMKVTRDPETGMWMLDGAPRRIVEAPRGAPKPTERIV